MHAITIENLSKKYNDRIAVDRLSLTINKGELLAFLGFNGAGKTTLFNLLTGVYEPTQGEVTFYKQGEPVNLNGMKPYKVAKLQQLSMLFIKLNLI